MYDGGCCDLVVVVVVHGNNLESLKVWVFASLLLLLSVSNNEEDSFLRWRE